MDIKDGYNKIHDKVNATKAYKNSKSKYDELKKNAGDSFAKKKAKVTTTIDKLKQQQQRYQREIKNQFEELLDIFKINGNGNQSDSVRFLKQTMGKILYNIEPLIAEILAQEALTAVGCGQQQTFSNQTFYIKVKSVDLGNLLTNDPDSPIGRSLYEKTPLSSSQTYPYPMNKQLYQRTQSDNDYQTDIGTTYNGRSNQPLFNFQYVEKDNLNQVGPWFKIDLQNRVLGTNNVGEFMVDYFKTIKVVDYHNIMAWIMESLMGAVSIKGSIGLKNVDDISQFMLYVQRVLGICFDNRKEIDVSGTAKISELDGVDNSFWELTDIDLRNIEDRGNNIKRGVVQFTSCDNVDLPVDADGIIDSINEMIFRDGKDQISVANSLNKRLTSNPNWNALGLDGSLEMELDEDFLKNMVKGLALSLFSPKILLPIFIMLKAIGQSVSDLISTYADFVRKFSTFFKNVISKIGALFVKELFKLIKKDILALVRSVISDLSKDKSRKKMLMILKLVNALLLVGKLISDWRECKSVVDEILGLLNLALAEFGGSIPLPLLFASQLLDGFSETRAFIGTIEELQKIGIPTGDMPDGSPNLTVLSMFSQLKAQADEQAENGKVQIAIPPLTMTPVGLTIPSSGFGKSF